MTTYTQRCQFCSSPANARRLAAGRYTCHRCGAIATRDDDGAIQWSMPTAEMLPGQFTGDEESAPFKNLLCVICIDAAVVVKKQRGTALNQRRAAEFLQAVAPVLQKAGVVDAAESVTAWTDNPREIDGVGLAELSEATGYGFNYLWERTNTGQIVAVRDVFAKTARRYVVPRDEARRVLRYSRHRKTGAGIRGGWVLE